MVWRITASNLLVDDPDALAYLAAVEVADGHALESGVRLAVNAFVKGCKADGIWNAIKASCILAGARTLAGALVPLVGAAPTNVNFVAGDYNRKTGLVGDGSTKYLNSNRNNNADPQNNNHNAVYASQVGSIGAYIACRAASTADIGTNAIGFSPFFRSRVATATVYTSSSAGLMGHSRSSSANYTARFGQSSQTITATSETTNTPALFVFARNTNGTPEFHTNARLAFYSIGESLDLALLDARVTALINAFAAAIP